MKRGFEMPEIFAAESGIKTKAQTIAVMDQAFRALLIHMDEHLGEHLGQSNRLRARQPHRTAVVAEEVAAEFT
jgi:hypothetical protein